MIQHMDDFLIDRVFQPISDALARWISCYGIAAFLLTGACLFKSGAYIYDREWIGLLLSGWMPFSIHRAHEMDKATPSEVMPQERVSHRRWRSLLLIGEFVFLPILILELHNMVYLIEEASWWGIIIAFYFMACYKRPAKPRRAKVPTAIMEGVR